MVTVRSVVTWVAISIFGILTAGVMLILTENVKELLKQRGANTLLIRVLEIGCPKTGRLIFAGNACVGSGGSGRYSD
jgi:hypothetical protein